MIFRPGRQLCCRFTRYVTINITDLAICHRRNSRVATVGLFANTDIEVSSKADRYEITCKEVAENNFQAVSRDLVYKFYLEEKPSAVELSGKKLKATRLNSNEAAVYEPIKKAEWSWDKEGNQCIIKIPGTAATEIIAIEK